MGLDHTLEKQHMSPPKKSPTSFWLALFWALILFLAFEVLTSRLRSAFPPCPEYGHVTINFHRGVELSDVSELARLEGSEPRLSGARYSLGGEPQPALTIEPQPPTSKKEFQSYMGRFHDSSLVRSVDQECAPVFDDMGTVQKRPRSMVELLVIFDWVILIVIVGLGSAVWRRRGRRGEPQDI